MAAETVGPDPASPPKARVFISYSRKDRVFADRLETALKARGFEPLIDRTEHLVVAGLDVELEVHAAEAAHAQGVGASDARDARRIHRHEKRRHALAPEAGTRAREDDGDRRRLGVRDPHLASGDAVAVAAPHRSRFLVRGVGPGLRLR